jgi:hypothetical protein
VNELAPEILGRGNVYLTRQKLMFKQATIVVATIIPAGLTRLAVHPSVTLEPAGQLCGNESSRLRLWRRGYRGSSTPLAMCFLMVFLDTFVRRAICRIEMPSRRCQRRSDAQQRHVDHSSAPARSGHGKAWFKIR